MNTWDATIICYIPPSTTIREVPPLIRARQMSLHKELIVYTVGVSKLQAKLLVSSNDPKNIEKSMKNFKGNINIER